MKIATVGIVFGGVNVILAIVTADAIRWAAALPLLPNRISAITVLCCFSMLWGVCIALVGSFVSESPRKPQRKEIRELHPSDLEG